MQFTESEAREPLKNNPVSFTHESLKKEIIEALQQPQVRLSAKFLYNELGSKIFEAICDLPEYYPTRTEKLILEKNQQQLKKHIGFNSSIIDLGSGNSEKALRLFPVLKPEHYVPIDFSKEFLLKVSQGIQNQFPEVTVVPLAMDFSKNFRLPSKLEINKKLFFYPGSSIGNFSPTEALRFLTDIFTNCDNDSHLLIGVDLVKDPQILTAAYNDSLGVTAAFNLNTLYYLNEIAETDFNIADWEHAAHFNKSQSSVEMHLIAKKNTYVSWPGGGRHFLTGESLHTESSYKYKEADFISLLENAGFTNIQTWTDPDSLFMVCLAQGLHVRKYH